MYYLVQYTAGYQDFEQGPHIFRGMPFNIVLVFFFCFNFAARFLRSIRYNFRLRNENWFLRNALVLLVITWNPSFPILLHPISFYQAKNSDVKYIDKLSSYHSFSLLALRTSRSFVRE